MGDGVVWGTLRRNTFRRGHKDDLKGLVRTLAIGEAVAIYDRNALTEDTWRPVRIARLPDQDETAMLQLQTKNGTVIDEPDGGCPAAGFSVESFEADAGMEYYSYYDATLDDLSDEAAEAPEPKETEQTGASAFPEEVDLLRVRVKANGVAGTVRTREGSKDHCIPANKVIVLIDGKPNEIVYVKRDALDDTVEVLAEKDDKVPQRERPVLALRLTNVTTVDGILLGAVTINNSLPNNISVVEAYAGVHLVDCPVPMLTGQRVFTELAVSEKRPNNEFYLALILRAYYTKDKQWRLNALVFCKEDNALVQVGLLHVQQLKKVEQLDEHGMKSILGAIGTATIKDFHSAAKASQRAVKAASDAAKA